MTKEEKNMDENNKFYIIWTIIWLLFIGSMCFLFKDGWPMWFLLIWFIGLF